jgi:cell division protein FtsQ
LIVFATGAFNVRHVQVVGASRATSARIDGLMHSAVGHAMMTVNTSSLKHRVAALPQVAAVRIDRSWPNTLRVTISERRAMVAVQQPNGWLLIDATATPYLTAPRLPAHVLPLTIAQPTSHNPTLRAAIDVVAALPATVRKSVIGVVAPSTAGIRLRLRGGSTVVWGGPEDSTRKARALDVLLRQSTPGKTKTAGNTHKSRAHVYDVSTPGFVTTL